MNNKTLIQNILMCFALMISSFLQAETIDDLLGGAMSGDHRDPVFVKRDRYRHPGETLKFFGLEPKMTVVEIWPGKGWYTEILAPLLREQGIYYAAGFAMSARKTADWQKQMQMEFADKLMQRPDVYDHVVVTELSVPERTVIAPPGTVDMVLTFRNVHNWMKGGYTEGMLNIFYRALKSGGILGIVEHRATPGTPIEKMIESGYVSPEFVIQLATAIGFVLEESSEINANPKDPRDHPEGVWTLPPTLRLCDKLQEGSSKDACIRKYTAIGESDRMTLRFRKP